MFGKAPVVVTAVAIAATVNVAPAAKADIIPIAPAFQQATPNTVNLPRQTQHVRKDDGWYRFKGSRFASVNNKRKKKSRETSQPDRVKRKPAKATPRLGTPTYLLALPNGIPYGWCNERGPVTIVVDTRFTRKQQRGILKGVKLVTKQTGLPIVAGEPQRITLGVNDLRTVRAPDRTIFVTFYGKSNPVTTEMPDAAAWALPGFNTLHAGEYAKGIIAIRKYVVKVQPMLKSVSAHEMGHILGLGHIDDKVSIMGEYGGNYPHLSPADREGLTNVTNRCAPTLPTQPTPKVTPVPDPKPAPQPDPAPAPEILWQTDYQTGDFSAFETTPWNNLPLQPTIASYFRTGNLAGEYTIPPGGEKSQNEPKGLTFEEGREMWFSFSTQLLNIPLNLPERQTLVEWKNKTGENPTLHLSVKNGQFRIAREPSPGETHPEADENVASSDGGTAEQSLGNAVNGKWDTWKIRVVFSTKEKEGVVDVWRNNLPLLIGWHPTGGTMPGNISDMHLKIGYARTSRVTEESTVLHDDWLVEAKNEMPSPHNVPSPKTVTTFPQGSLLE